MSQDIKDLNVIDTVSKDIGAAGICVITKKPYKVDDVIDIKISLPDGRTIVAIGIVKWVVEQGVLKGLGLSDFHIGLKFVKISDDDRAQIGKFVFNTMNMGGDPGSL